MVEHRGPDALGVLVRTVSFVLLLMTLAFWAGELVGRASV